VVAHAREAELRRRCPGLAAAAHRPHRLALAARQLVRDAADVAQHAQLLVGEVGGRRVALAARRVAARARRALALVHVVDQLHDVRRERVA
jgi:hypothetical protein